MSTITQKDILNHDATRVAMFLHAYKECSAEVQAIIDEMTNIIVDESIPADEREHATEALVEAFFPAIAAELKEIDESRNGLESTKETCAELDREEAEFANRLKKLMSERGMTQEKLAAMTGVGQPAISNLLNRACRPQRRTIARFAEALSIDPRELWPDRDATEGRGSA